MRRLVALAICLAAPLAAAQVPLRSANATAANDRNVILVMTDGLRWQEVFRGAEEALLIPANSFDPKRDLAPIKQAFLTGSPESNRAELMPFVWNTLIPYGQIYGDLDASAGAHVTNGLNFSYPGYNETLTGHPDPRIDSNDNKPNPNITVLEWLNRQPGLEGKIAAFGAWNVIAGIVNAERCGFPVNVSYDPLTLTPSTPEIDLLNRLKADAPRLWDDEAFDAPVFETALEYVKLKKPRVLFLSLGETDDWAHGGNYAEYLNSAHRVDAELSRLWTTLQSMPEYKDKTDILFMTDHGRGTGPEDWKSHGVKLPASGQIFIGLLGPGIPPTGVMHNKQPATQDQVAATLAALLGLNWKSQEPLAGKPLPIAPH